MAIVNLDLYSYELAMNTQVSLILPERRGVPHAPHPEPYPVLYLLHGHGQDYTSWLRLSRIELYLQNTDVIVVMPNGNRGSYVDGAQTHRYGSYLTQELPQALKNWFHITSDREHTMIAGMSMGGYGALRAALAYPDRYGAACALSAAVRMFDCCGINRPDLGLAIPDSPEIHDNFVHTFGPEDRFEGSVYDLRALARQAGSQPGPKPRLLQICGSEDPLTPSNADFADFLRRECPQIPSRFEQYEGIHDFYFWDRATPDMLRFFGLIA